MSQFRGYKGNVTIKVFEYYSILLSIFIAERFEKPMTDVSNLLVPIFYPWQKLWFIALSLQTKCAL